jgi:hypothetical protein
MGSEIVIQWADGEKRYPMPDAYTYREMARIKNLTGIRGGEIGEALMAGDTEAILALAVVASERIHDPIDLQALEDLPFGSVWLDAEPEEDPTRAVADDTTADGEQDSQTTPAAGGTPD